MSNRVQTLNHWIEAATEGLPLAARERIAAEIEDHYAEAQERYLAKGKSAEDAQDAAIADLGSADAMAASLRDAHFDREQYALGRTAVFWLGALSGMTILLSEMGKHFNPWNEPNHFGYWLPLCQMVVSAGLGIVLVMAARSALVYLREQYDIQAPAWGWYLFVAGIILFTGAFIAGTMLGWLFNFGQHLRWLSSLPWVWNEVWAAAHLGALIFSGLAVVFCVRQWFVQRVRSRRMLTILLASCTAGAGFMALRHGVPLLRPHIPHIVYGFYPIYSPLLPIPIMVFTASYLVLLATFLRIFSTMRQSGKVMAE